MAFVLAAFAGFLNEAFLGLKSAQIGGTSGQHRISRCSGLHVQTHAQSYLALCRSGSQPL